MKVLLTTLNAKYIHTSLALRWLYVANKNRFDIDFTEYTIKEEIENIVSDILESGYNILAWGVYIWNVDKIKRIIKELKSKNPHLIVIIGGPEVSYEAAYFLQDWNVEYVISGEGEFVLGQLLDEIRQGNQEIYIDGVSSKEHISKKVVQADLKKLAWLPSPYMLETDEESRQNRLVYFETSRGCPYQCQYCLSSLEKGVRYFPEEFIVDNLSYLINSNVRQIKFLDRTFNLNKKHTYRIFDFLIRHYRPGLVCQFEIYADLLDDDIIDYLNKNVPKGYFRFEIGIQSTYQPTNYAVKRKQDFELLAANIRKLMSGGKIDLHLDLIAGLPYESYDLFVKSFNDVFALGAKEVQLGFLKMLRGTSLRIDAASYGYSYNSNAPYEITSNSFITSSELKRIHEAEHALEKYWNSGRFAHTMNFLFESYFQNNYFEFFDELAQFYEKQKYPHRGYQLETLFKALYDFLLSKSIDLLSLLRKDYYSNFIIRPHGNWYNGIEKSKKKQLLYLIGQDKDFLYNHKLTRKIIEKQTAIDQLSESEYLLTIFMNEKDMNYKKELVYTFM